MEIRPLKGEDPERILELWRLAGLSHRPRGRDTVDALRAEFAGAGDLHLGAYSGGDLIGTVLATDDGRKGWINRLAVHPERQGEGVGTRLLREAEARLRSRGRRTIAALVEDWNVESLDFFQRRGYRLHEDIHYLSKREDQEV